MNKKAFEVACALIRVAGYSGNESFKSYLEYYAMRLLDSVESGNHAMSISSLTTIRQFLLLGTFASFLSEDDRSIIDSQISILYSAIESQPNESGNPINELQLQNIFTSSNITESIPAKPVSKSLSYSARIDKSVKSRKLDSDNATVQQRQERIFDIIRQTGNCRVKELQDRLPDISERTIRYDIQALVEQGKIERFGPGGPSTYYRPIATPTADAVVMAGVATPSVASTTPNPDELRAIIKDSIEKIEETDGSAPLWLDA